MSATPFTSVVPRGLSGWEALRLTAGAQGTCCYFSWSCKCSCSRLYLDNPSPLLSCPTQKETRIILVHKITYWVFDTTSTVAFRGCTDGLWACLKYLHSVCDWDTSVLQRDGCWSTSFYWLCSATFVHCGFIGLQIRRFLAAHNWRHHCSRKSLPNRQCSSDPL